MKKIMKVSKILLLIATIFSYVSSPIAVLADEIVSMPLNVLLTAVDGDKDGYIDNYELTYKSYNSEYDEEKTYDVDLETTFTYNDETTVTKTYDVLVSGAELNSEEGSSYVLDPISKYYNGTYTLGITVSDNGVVVYEDSNYVYNYSTLVGLTGKLNELEATTEEVGSTTVGNYDVTQEGEYTQTLSILTGELSPNGMYRVVYGENVSEVMSGETLRSYVLSGTVTDLTGKLAGAYSYTDTITVEEVVEKETLEYEVVNTYTYNYNANLVYGTDNDELFSTMYGITFEDGYMIVNAKGLYETESVITIGELISALDDTTITLELLDEGGNVLDLVNEEVLVNEIKNGYTANFTNGATASYVVVVKGDSNSDNEFTNDDLTGVMEGYLSEENMPSMDMFTVEEVIEDSEDTSIEESEDTAVDGSEDTNLDDTVQEETGNTEEVVTEKEEFGTITFEDVMFTNELLKENGNTEKEELDNIGLGLGFGEVVSEDTEIYVGDTIEVDVLVNSEDVTDYIDGIDAMVVTSDNLKLIDVIFDSFTGVYNEEGRVVGAGNELNNGQVVMTLVLSVIGDGTGTIELSGETAKYLNICAFATITKEIEIIRLSSVNNLSSLNASVGTFDIAFDKDVTVYTLTVPYDTESVILSGALEDTLSQVDGLIEYTLTEDKTTAIINVTAEDGTVKTYTVYIIKEAAPVVSTPVVYYYSSNNYLKSLEIDGYEVEFDKYTNEYKIIVNNDVTSLDIRALAEDYSARVEITGNEGFIEGENIVTITVTAENGDVREYKLVVTKEEKKQAVTTTDDSSNTAEKVVIIVLIILVVLGLLYLIFKKDDDEEEIKTPVKKEEHRNNNNNKNTYDNNKNNNNKNNKKKK